MAEQDKIHAGDSKDVAKLENAVEVSFEFSMVRRRSLDEVRLVVVCAIGVSDLLSKTFCRGVCVCAFYNRASVLPSLIKMGLFKIFRKYTNILYI